MTQPFQDHRVGIIGGGLAGLAAAVALCERGMQVELFEANRQLGGRAGSFTDPATGDLIDHCQHVGMGCCTNFADFCRRTGIDQHFQNYDCLHFFAPDGRQFDLSSSSYLPAPFHLAPSLFSLGYLSWTERIGVAKTMLRLARAEFDDQTTIGQWLREQGQSQRAIDRFWSVVLVSALGESIDRASPIAARKVFVDGFLAHRRAYEIQIPTVPLQDLYGDIANWLCKRGAEVHLGRAATVNEDMSGVCLDDGTMRPVDSIVVATSWRRLRSVLPEELFATLPELVRTDEIRSAPITAIHLWFDRPFMQLPHAVLTDRLSQWIFNRGEGAQGHYYQVVISASRDLIGRDRESVRDEVLDDLAKTWPVASDATLLRWRMVTQHNAVFSFVPGLDHLRPDQATGIRNLFLAGDWTQTGWPSTMESAVLSGYLASEKLLLSLGQSAQIVVEPLTQSWMSRWIAARRSLPAP